MIKIDKIIKTIKLVKIIETMLGQFLLLQFIAS